MENLLSWNVNGIRAMEKKGFLSWLAKEQPALLALQETKAHPGQLSQELKNPSGYHTYWNQAERKGYSGVAIYSHEKAVQVEYGFGNNVFDTEGRILIAEYRHFIVFNIYFPNGKSSAERLAFKLDFYREFFRCLAAFKKKNKMIIACGDFNTAHREIDLARPKENSTVSGFLPEERVLLDEFIGAGFVDTLRVFNKNPGQYTWWDMKSGARQRDIGWRIDYFFVDQPSISHVTNAFIRKEVFGSDHCPAGITVAF
jgi:exodeoxyribonuclease-3